jgi:hypothetical protein
MRRFSFLLVAAMVMAAGSAAAKPGRGSANPPAKAAGAQPRVKASPAKKSAPAGRTIVAKSDAKADPKAEKADVKDEGNAAKTELKPIVKLADDAIDTIDEVDDAIVMSDGMPGEIAVKIPDKVSASELSTQYQRIGRDLMLLQRERQSAVGVETEAAKLSCNEMQAQFKLIKVSEATTPESRVTAMVLLLQLRAKIDRLRGVALSQECLNNPLAKDCL